MNNYHVEKSAIASKVQDEREKIDEQPNEDLKWKMRARVGTKRKWNNHVEERYIAE